MLLAQQAAPEHESAMAGDPELVDCELRMVWGGGPALSFAGTISIDEGHIELVRNLSLQDDAVGTAGAIDRSTIELTRHSAATFGGVDVKVRGRAGSRIVFRWDNQESLPPQFKLNDVSVTLDKLLTGAWIESLDNRGTRIAIERQLRDHIRVRWDAENLVFSPGERLKLHVSGNRTVYGPGEHRLIVRMLDSNTNKVVQQQLQEVVLDSLGSFAETTLDVQVPSTTGVFQFEFLLQKRRFISSLVGLTATPSRKLEFVVVGPNREQELPGKWQEVQSILPFESNWWEPIQRLSTTSPMQSLSTLTTFPGKAVSSHPHQQRTLNGKQILVLSPTAWQAYPLRILTTGVPHRVNVQVPVDQAMRMIVSIQEPNVSGEVGPITFDSGIVVDGQSGQTTSQFINHEFIFWPKTNRPYILLMNPDPYRNASLVSIEVQQRSGSFVDSELQQSSSRNQITHPVAPDQAEALANQRLVAAVIDKPLLAENFGARRVTDPASGRALDSWITWMEASQRLCEFSKQAGYNSVVLTAAARGGAIFPSQRLQPSAKFDSGIFLSDGRSPEIKDLVELVCRQAEQFGLRVIIALELEGSLPSLKRFEAVSDQDLNGLQLDVQGLSMLSGASANGERPIQYNPLNSAVQSELEGVIRDVVQRYGHYRSFAGISLNLGPRTHFNFGGDRWGYDPESLSKFAQHLQVRLPTEPSQLEEVFRGSARQDFLRWRAAELSKLYLRIGSAIDRNSPGSKLYLNFTKLFESPPSEANYFEYEAMRLQPSRILLAAGIDAAQLNDAKHVTLMRPEIDAPLQPPAGRSWGLQLAADDAIDQTLGNANSALSLYQIPKGIRLNSFDEKSPFGSDKTRVWLFPHLAVTDDVARQRIVRRFMSSDRLMVGEGSWMAILGQAESLRELHQVVVQFPPVTMQDLPIESLNSDSTLRVRRATFGGKMFLQLVNGAAWEETIQLQVRNLGPAAESSCSNAVEHNVAQLPAGDSKTWKVVVQPYDIASIEISTEAIEIVKVEHQPAANASQLLTNRLTELEALINEIGDPNRQEPMRLSGGDFENWAADGAPAGWTVSALPDVNVVRDPELPKTGKYCLRIEKRSSSGVTAWIQSEKIQVVPTGRLAVEAWVRSAPGQPVPRVRLSLIGRYKNGKKYHRWREFGGDSQDNTIPVDWGRRPIVLLVPDIPNEELSELQVAFDVLKPGTVWIDDVKIYGMYLHPDERIHLRGQVFLAKRKLRENNLFLGHQLLDSSSARYLATYASDFPSVHSATTANNTRKSVAAAEDADQSATDSKNKTSWRGVTPSFLQQWRDNMRQRWQR